MKKYKDYHKVSDQNGSFMIQLSMLWTTTNFIKFNLNPFS